VTGGIVVDGADLAAGAQLGAAETYARHLPSGGGFVARLKN
jgi:hypothetical protein